MRNPVLLISVSLSLSQLLDGAISFSGTDSSILCCHYNGPLIPKRGPVDPNCPLALWASEGQNWVHKLQDQLSPRAPVRHVLSTSHEL